MNGKIDAMSKKLDEHSASDLKYQEKIDGGIAWIVKLVFGAIILGVLATILK